MEQMVAMASGHHPPKVSTTMGRKSTPADRQAGRLEDIVRLMPTRRAWPGEEAVYDFYSILKSVHVRQQFTCSRKKDSDSVTALIWIVLAIVSHASLNRTLSLRAFLLVVVLFVRSWL